jgi:hypothetical protein
MRSSIRVLEDAALIVLSSLIQSRFDTLALLLPSCAGMGPITIRCYQQETPADGPGCTGNDGGRKRHG